MDWIYALLALSTVAAPLAAVWGLLTWQEKRRARARMKRCSRTA